MTRLVQVRRGDERRVALVEGTALRLLDTFNSVHALALAASERGEALSALASARAGGERLDYDAVHAGREAWRLLPPLDHPEEPARCLVSGTGLTHLGSARNRAAMHAVAEAEMTDSMKMFRSGLEGGRPEPGRVGVAPEWFYKGNGTVLRAHGEELLVPPYAGDGGEEAEVAGLYVIGRDGRPWRLGLAQGNEFSDHQFERTNYLNLAGSKLRTCAIGPELVVAPTFASVPGRVSIERAGRTLWSADIRTGEAEMSHSLANLEHHHFKHEAHRRPGDAHVHFFGADRLSCGADVTLEGGDVMEVAFEGFGRPLRNTLRRASGEETLTEVKALG